MFDTLLETKATTTRRTAGAVTSVVVHAAIIVAAVVATGHATSAPMPSDERVVPLPLPHTDRPARPTTPGRPGGQGGDPGTTLAPPRDDVPGIPPIDVDPPPIVGEPLGGPWDSAAGRTPGGPTRGGGGDTFFESQVEKPAIAAPNNPAPRYPEILRTAGVEGRVLVQFVVDTTGGAEMRTVRVLASDHELFTSAVRATLPRMRVLPAETGGRKVRMWVQMPFEFALGK